MAVPDQGRTIDAVCDFLIIGSVLATCLRFLSRKLSEAGFWWDDWLALAALPIAIGENALLYVDVRNGLGKHAVYAPQGTADFLHTLFFKEILYNMSITLCKISVLFFYRRTFAITRTMRVCLWTLGFIFVGWFMSMTFTVIFLCQPVQKSWKPDLPGHCGNLFAFFLGQAIPNIVTDVVLLLLPLPYLWRLQIQLPQKIALVSVFLLGYFVVAISLIRLSYFVKLGPKIHEDITWNFIQPALWSSVEMSVGIISVSIPSLFYLLKKIIGATKGSSKGTSGSSRRNTIAKGIKTGGLNSFLRLRDDSTNQSGGDLGGLSVSVRTGDISHGFSGTRDEEQAFPMDRIHVKRDVTLDSNQKGDPLCQ